MKFTLYKPNSKNTGCAFSFDLTKDQKEKAVLYVSMIQQHSWNDQTKSGSFKENAKNSEKSGTIKLSPTEAGEIISSFKTRIPFLAFHRRGEDTTIIKFTPWDKKKKIKEKDGDKWYDTPAFGISVTRNSSSTFKLPLEAGETEALSVLLKEYILESFVSNDSYSKPKPNSDSYSNPKTKQQSPPKTPTEEEDDYGVPF